MILLITYDIRQHNYDYQPLYNELKSSEIWWHHLDSTWIIDTQLTPSQWYERLRPYFQQSDTLLIVEIGNNFFGWAPKEAWDWLESRTFR